MRKPGLWSQFFQAARSRKPNAAARRETSAWAKPEQLAIIGASRYILLWSMKELLQNVICLIMATAGTVTAQQQAFRDIALIPITNQFSEPAKEMDLEGRTLRFVPAGSGYRLTSQEWAWEEAEDNDETLTLSSAHIGAQVALQGSWRFPFSGQQWDSLYLNSSGSITFGAPENLATIPRYFYYRDIGAERAGRGPILAALWRRHLPGMKVRVAHRDSRLIVTQELEESPADANRFFDRMNRFVAQIVLEESGAIEFRYRECSFPDGSVLLAPEVRMAAQPKRLDERTFPPMQPPLDPYLDFQSVLVEQVSPLQIRFTIRVRGPIPAPRAGLLYWIFLDTEEVAGGDTPFSWTPWNCSINVSRKSDTEWVARHCRGETPVQVEGDQVRILVTRSVLGEAQRVRYAVVTQDNARPNVFRAAGNFVLNLGGRNLYAGPLDVSEASGEIAAPFWESFHHRWLNPDTAKITEQFYRRYRDDYDFLVVFTAFPYDNTEVGGSFSGGANSIRGTNIPVSDLGAKRFGSAGRLQGVVNPIMLGAPFHAETGSDYAGAWQDHARSMWLLNHEVAHRWGMLLEWMDGTARRRLWEPGSHWTAGLFAPSAFPLQDPENETSPMGGFRWEAAKSGEEGLFVAWYQGHLIPSGFSWLDLYAMGLAEESEVLDTKVIADLEWLGWDPANGRRLARGAERTLRIADVVAAMGPREGPAQKEFRTAFLLLTEENGEVRQPELLERIDRIRRLWEGHFSRATGGRATMITSLTGGQ